MPQQTDVTPLYGEAGSALNVDPTLLQAIGQVESGGEKDPDRAVSSAGALGRMQVMPPNLKRYNVTDPSDPRQNIHAGAAVLDEALTAANGNVPMALRIYQGGQDQSKWGPQNAAYPGKVAAAYQAITARGQAAPATAAAPAPAGPDATDAFLSGGAGPEDAKTAPTAPDATDVFLAGKADAPAEKAAPAEIDPITGYPVDAAGKPIAGAGTTMAGKDQGTLIPDEPFKRIGLAGAKGAVEGFGNPIGQTILSPEAQAWMDARQRQGGIGGAMAGLGSTVAGDIGTVGGALVGIPNALFRGAQGAVAQTGAELGAPQLGRDIASIPEAFAGSPNMLTRGGYGPELRAGVLPTDRPYLPRSAAEGNLLIDRPRSTDLPPTNLLAGKPDTIPTMTVRPGDPVPQSVGASASRDMSPPSVIDMTPKQVEAYRSTAEGQKLLESQQPGQADRNAYVPGVAASTAEVEQNVNAAREAKAANIAHPEVSQASRDQAAANNDARQQFQQSTFKSPVDINNATEARAAQAETDLAATWKNKAPADAQPVIDAADAIKGSPDGRRPVVRSAIDAVTNELYDPDGKLITDPEQLYGVRKHIDDLLSKEAGATDPKSIRAAANLQQLKTTLDGVIEDAAPGFKQYLTNFSEASRPIDEMSVLQGHESKLYDTQGRMQLSRVQTMMRNIVDSRAAPGINPYKSISDDTMQRLWNLRDDLRRSASAQELARTPGSDTTQTAFDLAKRGAAIGGRLVAHGVANHYFPVLGSLGVRAAEGAIKNRRAAGAQRAGIAKGLGNLNPNLLRPQQD